MKRKRRDQYQSNPSLVSLHANKLPLCRNSTTPAMSFSPPPPPPPPPIFHLHESIHSIPMLLPAFIFFLLFMCFLSMFLFRSWLCSAVSRTQNAGPGNPREVGPGLDPVIISSFPTLPYSAVRGLQEGKCGAECAVCLSEFSEGDVIRLLTVCCHAFHPACIDSWLESHTTCPMCRSDLEAPPDEAAVMVVREAVGGGDSHVIDVEGEVEMKESPREHSISIPAEHVQRTEEDEERIR